jgi:hypothetical protein
MKTLFCLLSDLIPSSNGTVCTLTVHLTTNYSSLITMHSPSFSENPGLSPSTDDPSLFISCILPSHDHLSFVFGSQFFIVPIHLPARLPDPSVWFCITFLLVKGEIETRLLPLRLLVIIRRKMGRLGPLVSHVNNGQPQRHHCHRPCRIQCMIGIFIHST